MSIDTTRVPATGACQTNTAPRFGAPQAITAIPFPVLGVVLHLTGMPVQEIFVLLGGCGALGAAAVVSLPGGRHLLAGLAAAVLRAAAGK